MPQSSPLQVIRNLSVIPTGYTSQQLGALSAQVRLGAFFSAQVESERYLQGLRAMVAGAMEEGVTEGEFLHRVRAWLQMEADSLGLEAPSDRLERMSPEEVQSYERDVRKPDSLARLRLIFRTQAEMCAGLTEWRRGMEPMQLRLFPAWRFIRRPGAKTFRADHVEHEDEIHLKADLAWWMARNDPEFGGFGNPWPPFGFNSWMWIVPVSRAECERLGVLRPGQKVDLTEEERELWLNRIDKVLDTVGGLTRLPKPEPVPGPAPEPKPEPKPETAPKPEPETQGDGGLLSWVYVPSQTREQAIERSRALCANPDSVKYNKRVTKEQIDTFNEAVERLCLKYGLDKLDSMMTGKSGDDVGAWTGGINGDNTITLNHDRATGGIFGLKSKGWRSYDLDEIRRIIDNYEKRKGEIVEEWEKKLWDKTIKQLRESARYGRHNVGASPEGIQLSSVIIHEFGHVIHLRALAVDKEFLVASSVSRARKRAMAVDESGHCDLQFISEYAKKDSYEFFAEAFAAREHNEPLPGYITDMLDEVIDYARRYKTTEQQ